MIELQRKLIGDSVRNHAFANALKATVKPESHVLDLGSGTGFLGFLAARYGAKSVTCIEGGDILKTSRRLAERNRITNCTFIQRHSTQVRTLPKVDILVSETLGNYALEENIIESIEDGKRFLKSGGIIIPGRITQFVCPITSPRLQSEIDTWDTTEFNLSLEEARVLSLHNMYVKTVKKEDLLAEKNAIRSFDIIDFSKKNGSIRRSEEKWRIENPVTVHGFALWWEAELVKGITLSTSPFESPTHWEQIYLPLLSPVRLKQGESIIWKLSSDSRWKTKINLAWTVEHLDSAGKRVSLQELDMQKGYIS